MKTHSRIPIRVRVGVVSMMLSDAKFRALLDSFGVVNPCPLPAADLYMASVDPDPAIWLEVAKLLALQPVVSLRLRLALKAQSGKQNLTECEPGHRNGGAIWDLLLAGAAGSGRLVRGATAEAISKSQTSNWLGQLIHLEGTAQENCNVREVAIDPHVQEKRSFKGFVFRKSYALHMTIAATSLLVMCVISIPTTSCLTREFLPFFVSSQLVWIPGRVAIHRSMDGEHASTIGGWLYFGSQGVLAFFGVVYSGMKSIPDMCGDHFWSHGYPMWTCAIPIVQVMNGMCTATHCLTFHSLFISGFLPQLLFAWATFAWVLPVTTPEHPPSFVIVVHMAQHISFAMGVIVGRILIHGTLEDQFKET